MFAEDADFVVITGKYLKGRNEIVTYHAELFTGGFQGSYLEVTSVAIRFLRPDVAVARVATNCSDSLVTLLGIGYRHSRLYIRVVVGGDLPFTAVLHQDLQ